MIQKDVIKLICQIDPAFKVLLEKFPIYPLTGLPAEFDPFESLVETIIRQQLSGKAAQTIIGRVKQSIAINPEFISKIDVEQLRKFGLSQAKAKTIKELAAALLGGLDLSEINQLDEIPIRGSLTQIWGIGNWTVDMFLMFELRHPDVWPVNDLGVQKGWQKLHNLPTRPTPNNLLTSGDNFPGIRSAVAWYCWRALEESSKEK